MRAGQASGSGRRGGHGTPRRYRRRAGRSIGPLAYRTLIGRLPAAHGTIGPMSRQPTGRRAPSGPAAAVRSGRARRDRRGSRRTPTRPRADRAASWAASSRPRRRCRTGRTPWRASIAPDRCARSASGSSCCAGTSSAWVSRARGLRRLLGSLFFARGPCSGCSARSCCSAHSWPPGGSAGSGRPSSARRPRCSASSSSYRSSCSTRASRAPAPEAFGVAGAVPAAYRWRSPGRPRLPRRLVRRLPAAPPGAAAGGSQRSPALSAAVAPDLPAARNLLMLVVRRRGSPINARTQSVARRRRKLGPDAT